MNITPFEKSLSNIIYLPPTYSIKRKIEFINTCDGCLHARNMGESFGLTLAEFSVKNKPIITCAGPVEPRPPIYSGCAR